MSNNWTFLSTHGLVYLAVAAHPDATQREIGDFVGVTERTAQKVIADLITAGYLRRTRDGRRNRYALATDGGGFRHALLSQAGPVRELVRLLGRE